MAAVTIVGASWPSYRGGRLGPFEASNGDLWAIAYAGTTGRLAGFRSQDGGASWSRVADTTLMQTAADAVQVGDVLYIAGVDFSSTAVQVVSLNLTTAAVTRVDSGTGPAVFANVSGQSPLFLARRSDGSFVVCHNGATTSVMGTAYRRVVYSRYSGGAWTNNVVVGGTTEQIHFDARGGIGDGSDRVHFFYSRSTIGGLYSKTLSSANALSGEGTPSSSVSQTVNYPLGSGVVDGSTIVYVVALASDVRVMRATSADSPSWATTAIEAVAPQTGSGSPGAAAADAGTIHALWIDASGITLWHEDDGGTNTWAGSSVSTGTTATGVSAGKITNAIGYLFDFSGTYKFDKISLVTLTAVGTSRAINYDVAAALGVSRAIRWDSIAQIGISRILRHDVFTATAAIRSIRYDLFGKVGASRILAYDLRQIAGASRIVRYDVAAAIAATRILRYDVFSLVGSSRAVRYDVARAVTATRIVRWDLVAQIGASRAIVYDVVATTAVGASRIIRYDVAAPVAVSRALRFDVFTNVATSRAIRYDLAVLAGASRVVRYDVAALAGASRAIRWDVVAQIGASRVVRYDVAQAVGASRVVRWDLAVAAGASRAIRYDVAALATVSRSLRWDLAAVAGTSRIVRYDLSVAVAAPRTLLWDLASPVGASRTLLFDVVGVSLQFASPISDVAVDGWAPTPLFEQIDEQSPSAADYIEATAV